MDRVFSMDDIADQFWSIHPPSIDDDPPASSSSSTSKMNRSASEWAFQRFIQEAAAQDHAPGPVTSSSSTRRANDDVVEIKGQSSVMAAAAGGPQANIPVDSEDYQAYLKRQLELACAAVALTRASNSKAQDSMSTVPDHVSHASNTSQLGSHVAYKGGQDSSKMQGKDAGRPVGVPPLPAIFKKSGSQVKSTTSGSSGEQSDDDEAEGENESSQNMGPQDAKRVRRMISNRESARRSRRRKQAHLTDLETQVAQLRVENSSLLKRLSDISQKYNEAAVDNRVLKADVETLRAKVKMAEETVKRVTGLNPFFQAMPEISTIGIPSFACSPSETSADAAVPVQDDMEQHYFPAPSTSHLSAQDHRIQNGRLDIPPAENAAFGANKMGRTVSMQRVASLEHLQKRIRGGTTSSGTEGGADR